MCPVIVSTAGTNVLTSCCFVVNDGAFWCYVLGLAGRAARKERRNAVKCCTEVQLCHRQNRTRTNGQHIFVVGPIPT